jgi:hypothetical protein
VAIPPRPSRPYLIVSLATPDGARQSGSSLNPLRELPDRNRDRHCGSGRSTSARNRCFDRFILSCRWEDSSRREPCGSCAFEPSVMRSYRRREEPEKITGDTQEGSDRGAGTGLGHELGIVRDPLVQQLRLVVPATGWNFAEDSQRHVQMGDTRGRPLVGPGASRPGSAGTTVRR